MPDISPSKIPPNAVRRIKGTRWEKRIDQSQFTGAPLERFIRAFSTSRVARGQDWFKGYRVGCIDDPELTSELDARMRQAPAALCAKLREIYKEPGLTDEEALDEIAQLENRYKATENPMWVWMTLDMYLQVGLPPPSWVWLYLAKIAYQVAGGAADDQPWFADNPKAREQTFNDKTIIKTIGFTGDGKEFKRYRQEIREYRQRHRVANLHQSAKFLKTACKIVAEEAASENYRDENSPEAKAATARVYRAYRTYQDHQLLEKKNAYSPRHRRKHRTNNSLFVE